MPRVSFHTLGCKLNFAETSTIARSFTDNGFDVVPFGDPAEVTVINTCSVTSQAEQKCRSVIRRAKRKGRNPYIVVTGCYAQLRPDDIAAIDGVNAVVGTHDKMRLTDLIDSFEPSDQTQVHVSCIDTADTFSPAHAGTERTRAFLKVQDGCDYNCSFCTIPMARGASRSSTIDSVVIEAAAIADLGVKEIVLSGVNVGLFGQEYGVRLQDLLTALDEVDGIARFRISSIEPNLLTEEIISFVAGSKRFVPHFHIPLQSGNDRILGLMRRRYRRDLYRERVENILRLMPDACIGVDVIVGFPGEDMEAFEDTHRFLSDLDVSYLHVFSYSERPGTPSADFHLDRDLRRIPRKERLRRSRLLQSLSRRKRRCFEDRFDGSERTVLWESPSGDSLSGFTDNYVRVTGKTEYHETGRLERVPLRKSDQGIRVNYALDLPVLNSELREPA